MKKKRGLTILYIPETESGRAVQLHLSYQMFALLLLVAISTLVGSGYLTFSLSQSPNSNEILSQTLELGQHQREFERDMQIISRRIDLLEIYALQAEGDSGGPLGMEQEVVVYTPPVRPFLQRPLEQEVRHRYGVIRRGLLAKDSNHQGVDFMADKGATISAAHSDWVRMARCSGELGCMIELEYDGVFSTRYAHMQGLLHKEGAWILQGSPIGLVGETGQVDGAHLHFELLFQSIPINPEPYFYRP